MSTLSVQLPGVWAWHDFASSSLDDALDRLDAPADLDLLDFALRLAEAHPTGCRMLAVCVELEGSPVDLQVAMYTAPTSASTSARTGLEAAAWAYSFLLGVQPHPNDVVEGPDALPALTYVHASGNEYSIVCSPPADEPPVMMTFRLGEPLSESGQDLCQWIAITSTWID